MKILALSNRASISSSVAGSFHCGFREATTPAIDIQGSNLGLTSFGYAEIPLSFASIPSMNFSRVSIFCEKVEQGRCTW